MQEEIFGPILPISQTSSVEDVVDFINAQSSSLDVYLFSENLGRCRAWVIHYGEQDGEGFYAMELVHWLQRCSHAPRKYDGSAPGVDVALLGC